MHEYSIAKDIGYIVFEKIRKEKPKKVNKVVISIGEAAGIDKEFLLHSLKEHIFKNTICENAEIIFEVEKPKIKCRKCGLEFVEPVIKCSCESDSFDLISGKDIFVKSIEIE